MTLIDLAQTHFAVVDGRLLNFFLSVPLGERIFYFLKKMQKWGFDFAVFVSYLWRNLVFFKKFSEKFQIGGPVLLNLWATYEGTWIFY